MISAMATANTDPQLAIGDWCVTAELPWQHPGGQQARQRLTVPPRLGDREPLPTRITGSVRELPPRFAQPDEEAATHSRAVASRRESSSASDQASSCPRGRRHVRGPVGGSREFLTVGRSAFGRLESWLDVKAS